MIEYWIGALAATLGSSVATWWRWSRLKSVTLTEPCEWGDILHADGRPYVVRRVLDDLTRSHVVLVAPASRRQVRRHQKRLGQAPRQRKHAPGRRRAPGVLAIRRRRQAG